MKPTGFTIFLGIVGTILYFACEHTIAFWMVIGLICAFFIAVFAYAQYTNNAFKPQQIEEELAKIDNMNGFDFEYYVASMLRKLGYKNVRVTQSSGDYGADILASYEGKTYAFQCKRYAKNVGVRSIQEVYAAKQYYKCDNAIVVTNMLFSQNAQGLARQTGVILWDRNILTDKLKSIIGNSDNNDTDDNIDDYFDDFDEFDNYDDIE